MRMNRAQISLAAIFITGLVVNAAAVLLVYVHKAIYFDNARDLLLALLAVYSGPLAIVFAGFFAQRPQGLKRAPSGTFWMAAGVALLWNLFLVGGAVQLLVGAFGNTSNEGAVDDFTSYIKAVSSAATFLVSGALAYFFAKREPISR